jgi:hypothetical protein
MRIMIVLACLLLSGCVTGPPPTSMLPATTPAAPPQPVTIKEPLERLDEAFKADDNLLEICKERIKQRQVTTAIGFVRCWAEPARDAYQQRDLLVMDLVEKRFHVMSKAALLFDDDQLTPEQFLAVQDTLQDWFSKEVRRRLARQLSAPSPNPSSSAVTPQDK